MIRRLVTGCTVWGYDVFDTDLLQASSVQGFDVVDADTCYRLDGLGI
jgi:hypothetical protein